MCHTRRVTPPSPSGRRTVLRRGPTQPGPPAKPGVRAALAHIPSHRNPFHLISPSRSGLPPSCGFGFRPPHHSTDHDEASRRHSAPVESVWSWICNGAASVRRHPGTRRKTRFACTELGGEDPGGSAQVHRNSRQGQRNQTKPTRARKWRHRLPFYPGPKTPSCN